MFLIQKTEEWELARRRSQNIGLEKARNDEDRLIQLLDYKAELAHKEAITYEGYRFMLLERTNHS